MHGKAQRKPARRAASPTNANQDFCICVYHRRHLANMFKPKCVANVSLQLVLCANFRGWAKTRQPFSAKVHQILGHVGESCRLTNFFPIVYIVYRCTGIFGQNSKSVPKSVFAPNQWGKRPGTLKSWTNFFSNSSHKWICVQVWLRSVQWPQKLGFEKRKKKERKKQQQNISPAASRCRAS